MGGTEESVSDEGSLICPPGTPMIFHKKETEKNELVARPRATAPPEPKLGVAVLDGGRPKLGTEAAAGGGGGLIGVEVEAIWSKVEAKLSLVPPPNGAEAAGG